MVVLRVGGWLRGRFIGGELFSYFLTRIYYFLVDTIGMYGVGEEE